MGGAEESLAAAHNNDGDGMGRCGILLGKRLACGARGSSIHPSTKPPPTPPLRAVAAVTTTTQNKPKVFRRLWYETRSSCRCSSSTAKSHGFCVMMVGSMDGLPLMNDDDRR